LFKYHGVSPGLSQKKRERKPSDMRAIDTLTKTELAQYPPLVYPDDTDAVVVTATLATETVAATVMVEGLIEHMYVPTRLYPEY